MRKNNTGRNIYNLFTFCLISINLIYSASIEAMEESTERTEIILVGASIGKSWDFPGLTKRTGNKGFNLEYIGVMDTFDKTPALTKILEREKMPDFLIIKECSVYFPGDLKLYKSKIKEWVDLLKDNNIKPILATSVPSGKPTTITFKLKSFIKDILGKPNKFRQLREYNDWLRTFGKIENIRILDIEAVLRISEFDRTLNPKYDRGDFTHLNNEGYEKLDELVKSELLDDERIKQ